MCTKALKQSSQRLLQSLLLILNDVFCIWISDPSSHVEVGIGFHITSFSKSFCQRLLQDILGNADVSFSGKAHPHLPVSSNNKTSPTSQQLNLVALTKGVYTVFE